MWFAFGLERVGGHTYVSGFGYVQKRKRWDGFGVETDAGTAVRLRYRASEQC